jgi:Fumarylacetoacetate (FAA) hydrolase family
MFHPADHPLERGWVGRIDGEEVTQLAAQTLQSFFTGGGAAREHATYRLDAVRLLAPVLHPPAIRVFEDQRSFAFANPAAICGPGEDVPSHKLLRGALVLRARLAGVIGAEGGFAGYTLLAEWRDPALEPPKDRDFALGLGPYVVTRDELDPAGLEAVVRVDGDERARESFPELDWAAARDLAAAGTRLHPGDLVTGPSLAPMEVEPGADVEIRVEELGTLTQSLRPEVEL